MDQDCDRERKGERYNRYRSYRGRTGAETETDRGKEARAERGMTRDDTKTQSHTF